MLNDVADGSAREPSAIFRLQSAAVGVDRGVSMDDASKQLFAPFGAEAVDYRPGHKIRDSQFIVFVYVGKEEIRDRLDAVLGPTNWFTEYEPWAGATILCKLSLRIGGEWITKSGVGGSSAQMKEEDNQIKSAKTSAFRNAAAEWGFARHLDFLPTIIWPANFSNDSKPQWRSWQDPGKLRKTIADLLADQNAGRLGRNAPTVWGKAEAEPNQAISRPTPSTPAPAAVKPTSAPKASTQPPTASAPAAKPVTDVVPTSTSFYALQREVGFPIEKAKAIADTHRQDWTKALPALHQAIAAAAPGGH